MNLLNWLLVLLNMFAASVGAQTVSIHASKVAADRPFFVMVQGDLPTPCSLDGNGFEMQFDGDTLELTLVLDTSIACPQVVTRLNRTFGAFFRLEASMVSAGQNLDLVFDTRSGDFETEIGRTKIVVAESGAGNHVARLFNITE